MTIFGFNYASKTATDSQASAASATATATGLADHDLQVVGFDGSSADQPFTVELKIDGTTILTMQGNADTSAGRDFCNIGPVALRNQDIEVVTTPAASGQCNANLIYRIIM
jgi:hypothetical protein